ncbi:unnamed protein product [Dibothriocephalus latus]|uniref:Uncharacterized protein n=1 Tax=Dibothriocephalus latus TaxID=60516 RepID=A0A3P7NJ05_DIBLA|nr:unnamed protein product [Dibothriocephalus latus]
MMTKSDSTFVDGVSQHISQFSAAHPMLDGAEASEVNHPNPLPTATITANTRGI